MGIAPDFLRYVEKLAEWIVRFPVLLGQFIDGVEDLYERGAGSRPASCLWRNLSPLGSLGIASS